MQEIQGFLQQKAGNPFKYRTNQEFGFGKEKIILEGCWRDVEGILPRFHILFHTNYNVTAITTISKDGRFLAIRLFRFKERNYYGKSNLSIRAETNRRISSLQNLQRFHTVTRH